MADLNRWLVFSLALLPPWCVMLVYCAVGPLGTRLAAVQLASALSVCILVALTYVLTEPSSIDLALSVGLLAVPATLLYALVLERWI